MKKFILLACVIGMVVSTASPLFAGGADNKTNWSAEYIRSLNRNAATDSADIVMYNPAGIMKMADGFYGNVSAHQVLKDYNNEINGTDYDQDKDSTVPGVFAVYKRDRWAGFFGLSNVVGGGKVEFDNGNFATRTIAWGIGEPFNSGLQAATGTSLFNYTEVTNQNFDGEQIGLGYTLGGAFKINDMFSVALAARYVDTEIELKGTATLEALVPTAAAGPAFAGLNDPVVAAADFEEDADGWGGLIGLNITPNDQWNIGIRYETKVDLDFDLTVNQDEITGNIVAVNFPGSGGTLYDQILPPFGRTKGSERTRNLPAILGFGVSYQVTPKVRLETNLTYYFNEDADFEDIAGTSRDESAVDNGYDLGIAIEYAISETVKGSFGYLYTDTGVDAENMTPWLPELNAHTFGTGLAWAVTPKLDVNVGLGKVFYQSDSFTTLDPLNNNAPVEVKYEKDITFLAFGLQYKFM